MSEGGSLDAGTGNDSVHIASRLHRIWAKRGVLAICLLPLSWLYGAIASLDRWLYQAGFRSSDTLPVPVVVVGNLIAGGAGKTPTVIAIVQALRSAGYTPGVISRGYRRVNEASAGTLEVERDMPAEEAGDEPMLIHVRTHAPVVVGRRRAEAGKRLLQLHPEVNVIVSDDGLQHHALRRSVDVVVFDERGGGNGWLLPAGPLRERVPTHIPERTLVLYNAAMPSTPLVGSLSHRHLSGAVSLERWRQGEAGNDATLESLRGRPLIAVAGLARPQRFFDMLRAQGLTITPLAMPDHHDFRTLPWPTDTADIVVTEKDAIKLDPARMGSTRVWVAPLDFALEATFVSDLIDLLPPPGTRHGNTPA